MASAVFSKLKSVSAKSFSSVSALATKAKTKMGPRMPRGSTVVTGIKLSFAVATTLGLSLPYMQGISDAASKVKEYADVSYSAIAIRTAVVDRLLWHCIGHEKQPETVQEDRGACR